mgnify:CR=1 FL=1
MGVKANKVRRFALGLACLVGLAIAIPVPGWADGGTCGAIDPSCPCGVGSYFSCKTILGCTYPCGCSGCTQCDAVGQRTCHWECVIPYPGADPVPSNVQCTTNAGCDWCP